MYTQEEWYNELLHTYSLTTLVSIFLTHPSVDGYDVISEMLSRLMLSSLSLADSVVSRVFSEE